LWNNDDYWQPSALTATGPVCAPNYDPSSDPVRWKRYSAFLHSLVKELVNLYQPDAFWFDCSTSSGDRTDTHLEAILSTIRTANKDAVVNVRNGVFSDYFETSDQQESLANTVFGSQHQFPGMHFEIPAVLQATKQ